MAATRQRLDALRRHRDGRPSQRVVYLIWREPWMAVGPDTFISRLLEDLGLENAVQGEQRYPVVDPFAVQADVVAGRQAQSAGELAGDTLIWTEDFDDCESGTTLACAPQAL